MKKPVVLIVSAAAGALVLAGVGAASAHTGLALSRTSSHSGVLNATSEPSETAEPTETPEAAATAEPTETPEASAPPETEANDNDTDTNEQGEDANENGGATTGAPTGSGEHEGGGHHGGGGGDD